MTLIPMTFEMAELWSLAFQGARDDIIFDGKNLSFPEALSDEVHAAIAAIPGDGPLSIVAARLCSQIDARAEEVRLQFITPGAGQALTYAEKATQARLCIADGDPDPANYPMLAAEIGITADTLIGVAQVVAMANAQWLEIGAAIEAARLSAKRMISSATTVEAALTAADAVAWP